MNETIRETITRRDELGAGDIDLMFEEAREMIAEGMDPEEVLLEVFRLEPDYIFDKELGII